MSATSFSRWQASGTHLLICVAIAVMVITVMLGVWYPGPLFEAAGGTGLLYILVGVDVILGPLLTLIVFKSGKRGMKFDLSVIGLVQIAALVYGVHIVFLARPAFIVFVKDRFELVTAVELDPAELAAAKYAEFRTPGWTGPRLVAADMPADQKEREKLIDAALAGLDLQHFPRYYAPYVERTKEVLAKADTIARLRVAEPVSAKAVDKYLASSGTREDDVRALMLRTRFAWLAVLVDPKTAQPVKFLLGEKIG
jgi:hypothetical protein